MLEEFARYCALQRDQVALASLLIYLKRKGGFVQLNRLWKDLGPSSGGPFWNQTTLMNKLDKLERLDLIAVERKVLPSATSGVKRKPNTFYRLNSGSAVAPHIFSMLRVGRKKGEEERYTSEMVEMPLDRLLDETRATEARVDPIVEKELEVALELIGEVFNIGEEDARAMVRGRLAGRGFISEKEIAAKRTQQVKEADPNGDQKPAQPKRRKKQV